MRLMGLMLVAVMVTGARSGSIAVQQDRLAAMLFAYQPRDGQREAFDRGYRQHLDWHRQAGDRLTWYAWDVLTGDEVGQFVDGMFGSPLEALDTRVDPAGDQRDFQKTTEPFAVPVYRRIYSLRRDLSTDAFLEDARPSPLLQVFTVDVAPGGAEAFAGLLRNRSGDAAPFAVYESVDGASSHFLVLAPRAGLAGLTSFEALVASRDEAGAWAVVRSVRSATWRYRADLTYLPADR